MGYKKNQVKEKIDTYTISDFEGQLDEIIDHFDKLRGAFTKKYSNLRFVLEFEQYFDGSTDDLLVFYGDRLETDREFEKRVKESQKAKQKKKDRQVKKESKERALYGRLKKKYEEK